MTRLKIKDVSNPVVKYLGFPNANEVAKAFNNKSTCPLCIECGDENHDPDMCYAHIEHTVDILGHSGEYGHLFEDF